MGNQCTIAPNSENKGITNPAEMKFKRIHPIAIDPVFQEMLDKLANVIEYPRTHSNQTFKWYEAIGLQFYLYGNVVDGNPTGQCLFYSKKPLLTDFPVLICANLNDNLSYNGKTLIIYPDHTYYYGSIFQSQLGPIAEGQGLLVSQDFIYDGFFKNGYPHGYGFMKTKTGDLTGVFENGQPSGECIEKTKKGLFIGELFPKVRKYGKIIAPTNEVSIVNEEYPQNGKTTVEL